MKREIKIGIFAVAMIGAAWAGIRFLKGFDIFSVNSEYYAAYDQINGVQSASPIMMHGVKIGSVTGITFDPSKSDKVILHFTINNKYHIPVDSEAKIFSNGLMGAKAVEIIYGSKQEYLNEGDTLRSSHDRELMEVAGSELEFFKQKFAQLTSDLSRTLNNVSDLLEKNNAGLTSTVSHLSSISSEVDRMLAAEGEHLQTAIRNFSTFAESLGASSSHLENVITNLDALSTELNENKAAEKLTATISELDTLLAEINSGEGSIGKLVKDPKLYDNLTQASENLSVLLADLKKYPGRYVHLSVFGRNPEKMKAKADRRAAKEAEKRMKDSLKAARR